MTNQGGTPSKSIAPVGCVFGPIKEFLIPSGHNGSDTEAVIFDQHHTFFVIWCENAAGIAVASAMSLKVAFDKSRTPVALHDQNEPGTAWGPTATLPTSGGFAFQLTQAIGAVKLQILLDTNTTAAVTFYVMGVDQAVG